MDPFTGLFCLAVFVVPLLLAAFAVAEALRKLREFSRRVLHSLIARMRRVALRIVAGMSVFCLDLVPTGLAGTRDLFLSMRYWLVADKLAVWAVLALLISFPVVWSVFGGLSAYVVVGVTLLGPVSWIILRGSPSRIDSDGPSRVITSRSGTICPDDCNPVFDAERQLQIGHDTGPGHGITINGIGSANSSDTEVDLSEERRSVEALRRILSERRLSRGDRDECKKLIDRLVKTLKCTRETVESLRALLNEFRARVAARERLTRLLHASITRLEKLPRADGTRAPAHASAPHELQRRYAAVDRLLDIIESSSSSEAACLRAAHELGEQRYFSEKQYERLSALYAAILDDVRFSSAVADAVGVALMQMEGRLESFRFTAKRPV